MYAKPRFLQGVYSFEGRGLDDPLPVAPEIGIQVPFNKRGQLTYFRAGNSSDALIYPLRSPAPFSDRGLPCHPWAACYRTTARTPSTSHT